MKYVRLLACLAAVCSASAQNLSAQIVWSGCFDAAGRPVPQAPYVGLGDIARATLTPTGSPIILYEPRVLALAGPVVARFTYLHECAHHARGQVIRLASGVMNPIPFADEQEADCDAIRYLVRNGEFGNHEIAIVQRAMSSSPGDATHLPGPVRATNLRACLADRGTEGGGRTAEAETGVNVSLQIWSRYQGNLTNLDVAIDGQYVGSLSNLDRAERIDIGPLARGAHSFVLQNITVFNPYGVAVVSGLTCAGTFRVSREASLSLWVRMAPSGAVTCGMR